MLRRFFLIVLAVFPAAAGAQEFPSDFWHDGRAVLESGDTLRGTIKYSLAEDLIQMKVGAQMETFTSRKAVFFEIFDGTVKRYRSFYSLPYSATGAYKTPIFFELLEEGKMTMLTRETLVARTYSSYYYPGTYTRMVLVNKYFLLNANGTITEFTGKKGDLFNLMGDKSDEVTKYSKQNKLDFEKKYDIARMINYYNSLFR